MRGSRSGGGGGAGGGYRGGGGGGGPAPRESSGGYRGGGPASGRRDGDDRGGYQPRGRDGGFHGGGGRGRGPPTKVSNEMLPKDVLRQDIQGKTGWLERNIVLEDLRPPGPIPAGAVAEKTIGLIVNHVPARIKLPKLIYCYHVDIDLSPESKTVKRQKKEKKDEATSSASPQKGRGGGGGGRGRGARVGGGRGGGRGGGDGDDDPQGRDEPKTKLWKKLVHHVIPLLETAHENLTGRPIHIATDFSKAMYTVSELEMAKNPSRCHQVEVPLEVLNDLSEKYPDTYVVTITYLGMIDTGALQSYMNGMKAWVVENGGLPSVISHAIENGRQVQRELPFSTVDQIYNIVLKTLPNFRFTPVGRAAFFPTSDGDGFPLGGGLVNWSGHSLIFNFGWSPFVNVDIANSAFLIGRPVLEVLKELFGGGGGRFGGHQRASADHLNIKTWSRSNFEDATKLLKTCKVSYAWPRRGEKYAKRVTEVFDKTAEEHTFTSLTGPTNVRKYCEMEKGEKMRHLLGPCLRLGNAIVPAEFCTIDKGQAYNQKLNEAQTAEMIKATARPPAERLHNINEALHLNNCTEDPVLKEFGVSVHDQLHTLQKARVLPRPTLVYGVRGRQDQQSHVVPPENGVWSMWDQGQAFVQPYAKGKPIHWSILEIENRPMRNPEAVPEFVAEFIKQGALGGLNLGSVDEALADYYKIMRPGPGSDLTRQLDESFAYFQQSNKDYKFILVIMPEKKTATYAAIKQSAELHLHGGLLTQCVIAQNVDNSKPATVGNILLKINSKLGGVNNLLIMNSEWEKIDILKCPVIIIGADVTHPPAGSGIQLPSMAAVTGSIDRTGMPYMMHSQAQRKAAAGAAEIIENLETIMFNMLKEFIARTGHKPRKIIFYRDGVGDGQFAEVLQREMMPIRAACRNIQNDPGVMASAIKDIALGDPGNSKYNYEPKITFIAVQKRHKTRFFPANPRDGVGKPGNAPPGTVVDTDIVKPDAIDFYLLSHTGIQGTSRPTRYQVLWDDSRFNMDELEVLSYFLCYMYCRCNRSVSYPAPTYYAHLAATRAKIHTFGLSENDYADIDRVNELIQRQDNLITSHPMHFV